MSAVTYLPATGCVCCLHLGRRTAATRQIPKGTRTYQACDQHAEVVERCASIGDAVREVKRHKAIRGGAL